jgi:type II restriction/modification system DNA methylase subunit YeeA
MYSSSTENKSTKEEVSLMHQLSSEIIFDAEFWMGTLSQLGYPLNPTELDISTLKNQKIITDEMPITKVSRLYIDDHVEVALIELQRNRKITRSSCVKIARAWRLNRLIRPLLLFTNGESSFAVIVPGPGLQGEARTLELSSRLYRTDLEVIQSMKYPGDGRELYKYYDTVFFPYEKVRDEFFKGYRELYQKTVDAVKKHLRKDSSSYAQRFLGRLMFLYFLQKKGWLNNDRRYIDKIEDYRKLNKLFYESLNREGTAGIPFLNGSLFEREEYMDNNMEDALYPEMDKVFKKAREFFNQYNFTVDELSPLEVEVSIDPALIGTVFENMLPEYERGSKGTFYTPRNESAFICRRALVNYLGLKDRVSEDGKKFIDGLDEYVEDLRKKKSEKEVREFKEKLLSVKVVDPAVGSGGFLLAMMQQIIMLLQEADTIAGWKTDVEEYKKRILPNLYGFDIEAEAVEIARLRLWLSLIIDQKEPEPLPNLDMNLILIEDSLNLPVNQTSIDEEVQALRLERSELREKYLHEHDARIKDVLRKKVQQLGKKIGQITGTNPNMIEDWIEKADIVVMNPPYVRQESIDRKKKDRYSSKYGLDKKSDIYAYFMVRALKLVSDTGVVSVISSDKWLEAGYGASLQEKLKPYLVAVYGQRNRSFGADINTVITVLKKGILEPDVHFIYLDSYSKDDVRQYVKIKRSELRTGKWFYLRPGAKFFIEKLLPKLTHKLGDFAEIKRGFTTGANEFFYMKDVSHLFEADRLADPKKFEELGVKAKTREELEKQGLIYIENEGRERFVLNREDVAPLIRSPKQLRRYLIPEPTTYCLYTDKPGPFTRLYIKHGEAKGFPERPTLKNRNPWYKVTDLEPTRILLPKSLMDKLYVNLSLKSVICDQRLYTLDYSDPDKIVVYLISTLFLFTVELYCGRLGGGASDIRVEDYEVMPVPNIRDIKIAYDSINLLKREVLTYFDEVNREDRKQLDKVVLNSLGLSGELLTELHAFFVEAVKDRLIKGKRVSEDEVPVETQDARIEEEKPSNLPIDK